MLVDVRVDNYRRPAQPTITEFGRFLGVGSRKIVIHWELWTREVSLVLGHASPEYEPSAQSAPSRQLRSRPLSISAMPRDNQCGCVPQ